MHCLVGFTAYLSMALAKKNPEALPSFVGFKRDFIRVTHQVADVEDCVICLRRTAINLTFHSLLPSKSKHTKLLETHAETALEGVLDG